tara:strand:+ start:253 stop:480 length:228 start_codon:yes stop_codon:yes gene_type:complete
MKLIIILVFSLFLTNCSLNKDSKFWNEDAIKKEEDKKKLLKITKKSEDITNMTLSEYKIYIEDYIKKSKYPDINK